MLNTLNSEIDILDPVLSQQIEVVEDFPQPFKLY